MEMFLRCLCHPSFWFPSEYHSFLLLAAAATPSALVTEIVGFGVGFSELFSYRKLRKVLGWRQKFSKKD